MKREAFRLLARARARAEGCGDRGELARLAQLAADLDRCTDAPLRRCQGCALLFVVVAQRSRRYCGRRCANRLYAPRRFHPGPRPLPDTRQVVVGIRGGYTWHWAAGLRTLCGRPERPRDRLQDYYRPLPAPPADWPPCGVCTQLTATRGGISA